jgi:hypothetical protein
MKRVEATMKKSDTIRAAASKWRKLHLSAGLHHQM